MTHDSSGTAPADMADMANCLANHSSKSHPEHPDNADRLPPRKSPKGADRAKCEEMMRGWGASEETIESVLGKGSNAK